MVGEQKNKKMASVLFHVFSCLLGFIMIYPLLWLVASSFKSNDTMFKNTYSLLPESWGISPTETPWLPCGKSSVPIRWRWCWLTSARKTTVRSWLMKRLERAWPILASMTESVFP